jgi:mono/diheme cytochrome c family protein
VTGLPCDVQKVLEDACIACHGGSQAPPMLSYGDLLAQSGQYPGQTIAQRALARMKSTSSPMPPPPAVAPTAAEIATFEAWANAGTLKGGVCTGTAGGGVTDGSNTPTVCTSAKTVAPYAGGDGSATMDPGEACLACHQRRGGPRFAVGGTVYKTAHEPDDCDGVNRGLQVIVTDTNGQVVTMLVNAAGNFYSAGVALVPPFTAKVTDGTNTRAMSGAVTAGDCNSCHTEGGANGAPGRIMAP